MKKPLNFWVKYKITCDQFVECRGIFRLPDEELKKWPPYVRKKYRFGIIRWAARHL